MTANVLFLAAALVASPGAGNPEPCDTTIYEPGVGIAFDLPRGYIVQHAVDARGDSIAGCFDIIEKKGTKDIPMFWPLLAVETEGPARFRNFPAAFESLSDPADTLLSYVKMRALDVALPDGHDASNRADSIILLRRYPSPRGDPIFEVVVRIVETHDSTALAAIPRWEASLLAEQTAAPVVDGVTARGGVPWPTGPYFFTVGPIFAADLSRGGCHLMVWVRPGSHRMVVVIPYRDGVGRAENTVGYRVAQTLRRQV